MKVAAVVVLLGVQLRCNGATEVVAMPNECDCCFIPFCLLFACMHSLCVIAFWLPGGERFGRTRTYLTCLLPRTFRVGISTSLTYVCRRHSHSKTSKEDIA